MSTEVELVSQLQSINRSLQTVAEYIGRLDKEDKARAEAMKNAAEFAEGRTTAEATEVSSGPQLATLPEGLSTLRAVPASSVVAQTVVGEDQLSSSASPRLRSICELDVGCSVLNGSTEFLLVAYGPEWSLISVNAMSEPFSVRTKTLKSKWKIGLRRANAADVGKPIVCSDVALTDTAALPDNVLAGFDPLTKRYKTRFGGRYEYAYVQDVLWETSDL